MSLDQHRKLPLMVVDDEPDNLDLLYRTFRRDYKVYKATSGFEALALLEQLGEMAIIISDQRMPRMNGAEFLSRTVERFPDTIRIVLTGYTDVEDLVEAINAGKVFKYITKPWKPAKLREVVSQAAETYLIVKQRTLQLTRALHRESLVNEIMSAVRESLDYQSVLQTVVDTLGSSFLANYAVLRPCQSTPLQEGDRLFVSRPAPPHISDLDWDALTGLFNEHNSTQDDRALFDGGVTTEQIDLKGQAVAVLTLPLIHQQRCLAVVSLFRLDKDGWNIDAAELIQSISDQVALAISQAYLYQQIQEQSRQMRTELEVARQIQMNLLRQSWPDIEGVRIQARCIPAREVGGDFFEIFAHPQGDIWLAVGDVSGKGVPAALFMASAISVLRRELSQQQPQSPEVLMGNLNEGLMEDLVSNNCFITMVLVSYSPRSRRLTYANAGHIFPLVWSDFKQPQPRYLDVRGVPLGILPTWTAKAGEIDLVPGDTLLMASDGLTEATFKDAAGGSSMMLKQEGLWRMLQNQTPPFNLDELLTKIQTLNDFQEDDQTVLSLEVRR